MNWFSKLKSVLWQPEVPEQNTQAKVDRSPKSGEPETDRERLDLLTPREREVFDLLLKGMKMKEAAQALHVQPTTISFHTTSLYKKLDIHNRAQLFLRYGQMGEALSPHPKQKENAV